MCINFTNPQGNKCQWGFYCTHAHGQEDIRNPNKKSNSNDNTTTTTTTAQTSNTNNNNNNNNNNTKNDKDNNNKNDPSSSSSSSTNINKENRPIQSAQPISNMLDKPKNDKKRIRSIVKLFIIDKQTIYRYLFQKNKNRARLLYNHIKWVVVIKIYIQMEII